MPTAACHFCSLPDDSIQVICEARCLLCSRCQIVPVIRKLLVDNTEFSTVIQTAGSSFNAANFVGATILGSQSLFAENVNIGSSSPSHGPAVVMHAIRGTCPLCESALSASMLSLIQTYWEGFKVQVEDEMAGKSSPLIELEEISPLLPAFLKRFRAIYESGVPDGLEGDSDTLSALPMKNALKGRPAPLPATESVDLMAATKTTLTSVLEFILDCYCAQWSSILRNGHDSMLTIMMRVSTKKKMSQKTNDFKTKALIDFLSSPTAADSPEIILFTHLVGMQPKSTTRISPAWSQVATKFLVVANCERCLRQGLIHDLSGNPSAADLRTRLVKVLSMPYARNLSVKKLIRILRLFVSLKEVYFTMAPLGSACVEYSACRPWAADSMSKLLNVLLHVATADISINGQTTPLPGASRSLAVSEPPSPGAHRGSIVTIQSGLTSSSMPASPLMTKRGSIQSMDSGITRGKVNRVDLFRGMDSLIDRVWTSNACPLNESVYQKISTLDDGFVSMTLDDAAKLFDTASINLIDAVFVIVRCWEAEYYHVKRGLNKGALTVQRRDAIMGVYDPNQAVLTAADKLAVMRLLHYYSIDGELRGVDWDEVLAMTELGSKPTFPFTIPDSLLGKSRNELNYLCEKVTKMLLEQKEHDELEDIRSHGRTLVNSFGEQDYSQGIQQLLDTSVAKSAPDISKLLDVSAARRTVSMQMTPNQLKSIMAQGNLKGTNWARKPITRGSAVFSREEFDSFHAEVADVLKHSNAVDTLPIKSPSGELYRQQVLERLRPLSGKAANVQGIAMRTKVQMDRTSAVPASLEHFDKASSSSGAQQAAGMTMVDQMDNDGDVLNNSNMLSLHRPLSGKHLYPDQRTKHAQSLASKVDDKGIPSKLEHVKTPLEDEVDTYLPITAHAAHSSVHHQGHFKVYLEQGTTPEGRPILQVHVDETELTAAELLEAAVEHDAALQATVDVGMDYTQAVAKQAKHRSEIARQRILSRVQALDRSSSFASLGSLSSATGSVSTASTVINNGLVMPYLYLTAYLNTAGNLIVDINNNLYAESRVLFMDLQQSFITLPTLKLVLSTFCKEAQLKHLKVLDLAFNPQIGNGVSKLLHKHLHKCCCLIQLNLNGVHIGELGLKLLLQGIIAGGGADYMLRLDLQCNNISIATDGFELLRHFHSLQMLDLAMNQFTLDTGHQLNRFAAGLKGLTSLTALSIAHNKVQDVGFAVLVDTLLFTKEEEDDMSVGMVVNNKVSFLNNGSDSFSFASGSSTRTNTGVYSLRVLDVSGCFLTSKSEEKIRQLMESHVRPPPGSAKHGSFDFSSSPYINALSNSLNNIVNNGPDTAAAHTPHQYKRQESTMSILTLPTIVVPETDKSKRGSRLSSANSAHPTPTAAVRHNSTNSAHATPTAAVSSRHSMVSAATSAAVDLHAALSAFTPAPPPVISGPKRNKLPIEKIYITQNLLNSLKITELQEFYRLTSGCELLANVPVKDGKGPKVKHSLLQRKYLSDVDTATFSNISELECFDLKDYGIVKNRDAVKLV